MKKAANVEILIVGNEILTGDILDTNTNWLCKMVHGRGGTVVRVTVLPDVLDVIAEAVRSAVRRKVDILFISGGLGPTSDDLTLQAVAAGTEREVVLHPEALKMVRKQYEYFFARGIVSQKGLTPDRKKWPVYLRAPSLSLMLQARLPVFFSKLNRLPLSGQPEQYRFLLRYQTFFRVIRELRAHFLRDCHL